MSLQETFVKLSQGREQDRFAQLFASHPASAERVQNNKKLALALPKGGELGAERYQRVMAKMIKAKPAYDKYDEALKAYKDGNEGRATSLVREAIRLEPREGHFHSFLGDMARMKKQYASAKRSYDTAISLNKEFFYYYLGRGKMYEEQRQFSAAEADLNRSMQLLPTGAAQEALGNVAKARRDFSAAKTFYRAAVASGGAVGDSAMGSLMELDLEENPGGYVQTAVGVQNGEVVIQVKNTTPKSVTGLAVRLVDSTTGNGSTQNIGGTLASGKSEIIRTGLRMSSERARALKASVTAASLVRI